MSFRIIAAFVIFLFGMRVNAQTVMPSEPLSKALTIFELPPFERAVCCIKYYEGLHRKKDYPYVGYGHRLRPGERYSSEMTATESESLLRKDLKELCSLFRPYGKDSLLLSEISDNKRVTYTIPFYSVNVAVGGGWIGALGGTIPTRSDENWTLDTCFPFVKKDSHKKTSSKALVMAHAYSNVVMDKIEECIKNGLTGNEDDNW